MTLVDEYYNEFDWGIAPTPLSVMRAALAEIASYNSDELRSEGWGEENAADMVDLARAALEKAKHV